MNTFQTTATYKFGNSISNETQLKIISKYEKIAEKNRHLDFEIKTPDANYTYINIKIVLTNFETQKDDVQLASEYEFQFDPVTKSLHLREGCSSKYRYNNDNESGVRVWDLASIRVLDFISESRVTTLQDAIKIIELFESVHVAQKNTSKQYQP